MITNINNKSKLSNMKNIKQTFNLIELQTPVENKSIKNNFNYNQNEKIKSEDDNSEINIDLKITYDIDKLVHNINSMSIDNNESNNSEDSNNFNLDINLNYINTYTLEKKLEYLNENDL